MRLGWKRLWTASAPLTATGLLMLGVLAATLAGLLFDPRVITGAPAWLKPAKFAASIAIYTFTLAWIFSLLPGWRRTIAVVGWITAIAMVVEIVIIGGQAWRGTTSHFNVGTPLDAVLFVAMGVTIVVQTFTSVAVAVALWRTTLPDRALGWALRLGMSITIAGAFTGGLMTRPTADQLDAAAAGERLTIAGAHTVGAPDGGPGLPGTGWSTGHGDLRAPHFVGLHAVQVLPLIATWLGRRAWPAGVRTRLAVIASISYASWFVLLRSQALRGEPAGAPGALTSVLLAAWAAGTVIAATAAIHSPHPARVPGVL